MLKRDVVDRQVCHDIQEMSRSEVAPAEIDRKAPDIGREVVWGGRPHDHEFLASAVA